MRVNIAAVFCYSPGDHTKAEFLLENGPDGYNFPAYNLSGSKTGLELAGELLYDMFGFNARYLASRQTGTDANETGEGVTVYYFFLIPAKLKPYCNMAEWVPIEKVVGDERISRVINIALNGGNYD
jgi:hypothetical protein